MVELIFGSLTSWDIILGIITGVTGNIILSIGYRLTKHGGRKWKSRKLVHVGMGTVIAFTLTSYSNLSGPAFAAGVFLVILFYVWAHKRDLIMELLNAGSREYESRLNTFASSFMGLVSFALTFLIFLQRPEIFVASFLTVAWGDAAGEIVGRPFGGRYLRRLRKNKSLEGTIAVFLMSFVAIFTAIGLFSADTCPFCVAYKILFIAFIIAILEAFSIGWTDNFVIPLVTAIMLWVLVYPSMELFSVQIISQIVWPSM